jgi:hypothetical protein
VPASDRDEFPGRLLRPPIQRVAPTEWDRVVLGGDAPEAVVEHTVDAAVLLVDAGVLGGGVEHEVPEALDRRDGVDPLPE